MKSSKINKIRLLTQLTEYTVLLAISPDSKQYRKQKRQTEFMLKFKNHRIKNNKK